MKKTILVVDDQEEIRDLIEFFIEGYFLEINILQASSGKFAIETLKKSQVDAIICDYCMPGGNGDITYNYNNENNQIPFIWHSASLPFQYEKDVHLNYCYKIDKPATQDNLIEMILNVFSTENSPVNLFSKVKAERLLKYTDITCEVYVLINEKFILLNKEGNNFNIEKCADYHNKGLTFFYLKSDDFKIISKLVSKVIIDKFNKCNSIEDINMVFSSLIFELYENSGLSISNKEIDLLNEQTNRCLKQISQTTNIREKLEGLINVENYISSHSNLIIHLANLLLRDSKHKEDYMKIITPVAIMHDLNIKNQRLARFFDISGPKSKELSSSEQDLLINHGLKTTNLLIENGFTDDEILHLIKNHHRPSAILTSEVGRYFYVSFYIAHHITQVGLEGIVKLLHKNIGDFTSPNLQKIYKKSFELF